MMYPPSRPSSALTSVLACAAIAWAMPECACAGQPTDGALTLFDGRTLDAWEGDPQYWRVEGGAITGEIGRGQTLDHNTWLVWRGGELTDFDLQLEVRLEGELAANSGIQFRCQVDDINHVAGYQADLDQGAVWLGRIYDEHGRALLVERGQRVVIDADGTRTSEVRAPASEFAVLFRESEWNTYRIVAIGNHIAVYVNGTLFSELRDEQQGARDLRGHLALQLHSGPATKVQFRKIVLEPLSADDNRLPPLRLAPPRQVAEVTGPFPQTVGGVSLNTGLETGSLEGWRATGDAFRGQPVEHDGIASRWPGQTSGKAGRYFIGGYENVADRGVGTLESEKFRVTHPYASLLIGGGSQPTTRVEIVRCDDGEEEQVLFTATGQDREQMRRVVFDLREHQDAKIYLRLIDENRGGWGHLNFDDFRFHDAPPVIVEEQAVWRSTKNPLLQHLVPNLVDVREASPAQQTTQSMFVPDGFAVDVVTAEPDLHQPMAFTFDARGRIWVVEGHSYPEKRPAGEGLDRILIFADNDGDGTYETRKIFATGLNLVSGLEVGFGGVWVGAAPELLFIPDENQDDRPDAEPVVLLNGFGYADTHETINSFTWGPDGWLYGNQGVFNDSQIGKPGAAADERTRLKAGVWRYHPIRHQFEVFAHGGSNQWGLDFDIYGQLFMTHCRSYWGQGATTHVIQNGHYWNQVNGGYADFISTTPLDSAAHMKNYMLASARYGHGEGGAGKRGSRAVYGGHSHVGTMIYLGDNWPETYRNHLFTHNLHGHQMNQQVNLPEGASVNTIHAGSDVLFCADPQYIGVDLKYGPDGAVYITDWYDPRHCHNPDIEQWDRSNGRIYRMKYVATFQPVRVALDEASDEELVETLLHPNDWHVRTALRLLSERCVNRPVSSSAVSALRAMAAQHSDPSRRLRAVWALHGTGNFDAAAQQAALADANEYVRGWGVQLMLENPTEVSFDGAIRQLARDDSSPLVRRYLASAIPRFSPALAWDVAEQLALQAENAADRQLPLLIWYGLASLVAENAERGMQLAEATQIPQLRDYIQWYLAKRSLAGRDRLIQSLQTTDDPVRRRHLLGLLELGTRGMRGVEAPPNWDAIAEHLYDSDDRVTRRLAESLGAAFGDTQLFARMRGILSTYQAHDVTTNRHALDILAYDASAQDGATLLALLDSAELASHVLPLLAKYDRPEIGQAVYARLGQWEGAVHSAALELLVSRPEWAGHLLRGLADGSFPKEQLTAYYARQIFALGNTELNQQLAEHWGTLGESSQDRQATIEKLVQVYQSAPLWAYSQANGAKHFEKHCATCHNPDARGIRIGPNLAGTGSKGIRYIVENVVDPNAVIGRDFQARNVLVDDGRVITGLIESETDSATTVRTATHSVTVANDQIEEIIVSDKSFMPDGLLTTLSELEQIELLKYLMTQ